MFLEGSQRDETLLQDKSVRELVGLEHHLDDVRKGRQEEGNTHNAKRRPESFPLVSRVARSTIVNGKK